MIIFSAPSRGQQVLTPLGSEQTTSLLVVLICLQPTMGGFIKFGPKNKRTHATIGPCTFSAGVIDKIMWTTYYNHAIIVQSINNS